MKSISLVACCLLLLIVGCSSESEDEDQQVFRVAVLTPSTLTDLAFSQSMYDATRVIQAEADLEIEFVYSPGIPDIDIMAQTAIRDYANEGYDLIIVHGSQYGPPLQEVAPDFPNTSFAWGTVGDTFGLDNVYAYTAAAEEGGYINGLMAAMLADDVIGIVAPTEIGDAKLYVDGFMAGVEATKSQVEVKSTYIGSFHDVALAQEAAQRHQEAGADVLTGASQMVIGAMIVAQQNNIPWLGTQTNQTSLAPDLVVANQVYKWEVVLRDIIDNIQHGQLGGERYTITLENDGLAIEFNPNYELSRDILVAVDAAIAGIKEGSITIDVGE